jgi:hypothetical protein
MNQECQIKDDDEIIEEEANRFNFRRFKPEELEKKYSPFERIHKKEFPFLFQKKRSGSRDDTKISLEDIITKVADISMNNTSVNLQPNQFIYNGGIYEPTTPPFSPFPDGSPIPMLQINETKMEDLKLDTDIIVDGKK